MRACVDPMGWGCPVDGRSPVPARKLPEEDQKALSALLMAACAPNTLHGEPWSDVMVQDAERLRRLPDHRMHDVVAPSGLRVVCDACLLVTPCAATAGRRHLAVCWLAARRLVRAAQAISARHSSEGNRGQAIPSAMGRYVPINVGTNGAASVPSPRQQRHGLAWRYS